jgi:hypothetical protein
MMALHSPPAKRGMSSACRTRALCGIEDRTRAWTKAKDVILQTSMLPERFGRVSVERLAAVRLGITAATG